MTKRRNHEVGTMIYTTIIQCNMKDGSTDYYWIELPEGMTDQQALNGGVPAWKWHGPFVTGDEAEKDMEAVICGDIPVIDGGILHSDWETRQ